MIPYNEIIVRLILSALIGMIIGVDRQIRNKEGGLRTHGLIASGAALYTIISLSIPQADPGRVIAQIVTGVGFIGAGVIFKSQDRVRGITTAADIWMSAGIGTAIGLGMYKPAMIATIIILLILVPARAIDRAIYERYKKKHVQRDSKKL